MWLDVGHNQQLDIFIQYDSQSSYKKAGKKIVKRKKKRIEREANSWYVEEVIDVE